MPLAARAMASRRISQTISLPVAPSAIRIPISLVRRVTAYARMPYRPMHASTSANVPKAVDNAVTRRSLRNDCSDLLLHRGNIVDQDRGAHTLNFPPHRRRESDSVACAAHGQRQAVDAIDRLRDWKIDEARWLLA